MSSQSLSLCGPGLLLEYPSQLTPVDQICLLIVQESDFCRCDVHNHPHPSHRLTSAPASALLILLIANLVHPAIASQIATVTMPLVIEATLDDPALLHLAQLLVAELQAPQISHQLFVTSLVLVLTTRLIADKTMLVTH